jgi:membrane associated rhomboid family serine protease
VFPISDLNPTRRTPYLTYGLILVNVLVFLSQLGLSQRELARVFLNEAIVPALVTRDPFSVETLLDFLRSMFFHGGWAHLLSNMLYLWIFGDNVEDRLGKIWYLVLYFGSGAAAGIAQILIAPDARVPMVGASGAIAGVLGSYILLYPGVRVRGLILFGFIPFFTEFPAIVVLGLWFITQLFNGVLSLGVETMTGGVAFFAHIGGFVAGVVLTWLFMLIVPQPPAEQRRELMYQRYQRPAYRDNRDFWG